LPGPPEIDELTKNEEMEDKKSTRRAPLTEGIQQDADTTLGTSRKGKFLDL